MMYELNEELVQLLEELEKLREQELEEQRQEQLKKQRKAVDAVQAQGIEVPLDSLFYVNKNYDDRTYINFALDQLRSSFCEEDTNQKDEYVFSREAVDCLLKSYVEVMRHLPYDVSETIFAYMRSNADLFFHELARQYDENTAVVSRWDLE